MPKKSKKRTIDRLAKKRGLRTAQSRQKRKKIPKTGKRAPALTEKERETAEAALMRSALLLSLPQLGRIHMDMERLTAYLEDVKSRGVEDPREFVNDGLRQLADQELLNDVKLGLAHYIQAHREEDPDSALSASLVLSLMTSTTELSQIPFFVFLFVREVKGHPMADDPAIWRLLSTFLPSRIVSPEEKTRDQEKESPFERSKDFPHIVVPKGYAEEANNKD